MATLTLRLEAVELTTEARQQWYARACEMRDLNNFVWRQWEAWHTQRDSTRLLREDLDNYAAWKETPKKERGEKPTFRVQAWHADFATELYHAARERFPALATRVLTLAIQKIRGNVVTKKSIAVPSLKWWQAILIDRDRRGSSKHPQPIPFDRSKCKLLPCDSLGRISMEVSVDRVERPGKKTALGTVHEFFLKTGGKRRKYAQLAHELAAGQHKLRGSQLVYNANKKKWFVCLTIDQPDTPAEVDAEQVAVLRAGTRVNWKLRINGTSNKLGGRGHHVAHVRRGLLLQRWGRQESYRHAPARKGRGKQNALAPLFKLQNRWNNFTRRLNDELVTQVVQTLVETGTGTLVLVGGDAQRLLAVAGKIEGREDSTGWPWHQLEQLLEQKCNKFGIAVVKRAFCGGKHKRKAKALKELAGD